MSAKAPRISVITAPVIVAAVVRASDLDRGWFKRHPARAYRVRRVIPGEHPSAVLSYGRPDWPVYTLVKQLLRGTRMRVPFRFRRSPCGCESCLAQIWEQCGSEPTKRLAVDVAGIVLKCRP